VNFEISSHQIITLPEYSLSIHERIFKKVDFQLPLGQTTAINSPFQREKLAFSNILTFSHPTEKYLSRFCICII
jgi:hypothetical protein